MDYHFLCNDCKMVEVRSRPVSQSGDPAWCSQCSSEMQRMFFPPRVVSRSKPGSFRFEPGKMNAWDDRLAHLKRVEETEGSAGLQKAKKEVGVTLFHQTLAHKKQNYAS